MTDMADRPATVRPRLLLNAEPFGFGPAAAVAILADALAPLCGGLGYVGDGLTLDLQRRPPYAAVHDTTGLSAPERLALLRRLAPQYDLFVSAMDFEAAELASRAGLDVAVYDALTWYWPTLPPSAYAAVLYLAQDFFGVRERIEADAALRERAVVVPPIIPPRREWRPGGHVLVNLGGLQHPYWETADAAAYARLVLEAVRAARTDGRPVVAATSRDVAAALDDPGVGTYDHAAMLNLMSGASYACMTPGLGNMYDAAATGVPTLWLPPVNESHAAQALLLAEHGYCDARLDWPDLGLVIDWAVPLPAVLDSVAHVVRQLAAEHGLRKRLTEQVAKAAAGLGLAPGRAQGLADRFGDDGMRKATAALVRTAAAAAVAKGSARS
ncbi:hypothetical protein QR77_19470 [Streptomyces sp. 150FB]|nr:hypothetical protein QR77_19470 [Streptomyces sp. 150FB]